MNPQTNQLNVLFFGYQPNYGHNLQSKISRVSIYTDTPWGVKLDGGLLCADAHAGVDTNPTGEIKEVHQDGWTACAFWDRSGDSRPNSNSAFIVHADIPAEQLIALARAQWPEIFARPGFPIK